MKRSWYDLYTGPLEQYKKRARTARPAVRIPGTGIQAAERTMARSSRTYQKRKRSRGGFRRRFRRRIRRSGTPYSVTRVLKTSIPLSFDLGAAGAISVAKLKLNSAYDPSGDIGAQQPLLYDQYTPLYQRAAVIGWSCKFQLVSTDNTHPMVVGFTPMVSSTSLTAYDHYRELPGTVSVVVTPDVDKNIFKARGGVKRHFMPRSGRMLSDDTVTHGVGGDPSRILYGHLWAQAMDKSTDVGTVRVIVDLYQTVVFYVPEIPSRS